MFRDFLRDEYGQDVVEYSLLLVLIGALAVITLTAMGTSIQSVFSKITGKLSQADNQLS